MYSIVHEEPEALKSIAPDSPAQLVATVSRLMAKDPKKRYESAAELSGELRQLARDLEYSSYSGQVRTIKKEAHLSWRSVIVAGLAVLALGWFASALMEGGDNAPRAQDQYDVAVMYFDDLTGQSENLRTGKIVSELLTTGLSGSSDLRVLSSQRLYDILKQVGNAEGSVIDQSVATEIAHRAGARHMITGTIASAGDRTRLMANLIDVSSGRVVRAEQVEGGDLFAMVDSVCARLHDNIAPVLADAAPTQTLSVADVTTNSVDAYRLYSEGLDYYHKLDWDPAIAHFDSAIALDSNFALAYLRAAIASFSSNRATKGFQYVGFGRVALEEGTLPQREGMLVSAFTQLADNNIRGAVEEFETLVATYPDEKEAYFWLGTFQWQTGDAQEGIANMRRSLELDPEYPFALINLAEAYKDLDDIPNAISVTERYVALQPEEATPRLELSDLYIRLKQYEKARSILAEASLLDPGRYRVAAAMASFFARRGFVDSIEIILTPFLKDDAKITDRTAASDLWAASLFLNGRFGESFAMYRSTAELQRQEGDSIAVSGHLLATAIRHLAIGEPDSAQIAFDEAYDINPDELKFSDLPYRIALARGESQLAATIREKLYERYAKSATEDQLKRSELAFAAHAAWYSDDYAGVLQNLQLLRRVAGDPDDYSYAVGVAQLETGHPDSARQELDRSLLRYNPFNANSYWIYSWYQLGRTHEALGNRGDAVTSYRTFLRYWGRSDRPLPEVQTARERIRQLSNAS
jgi:tetratricopeptide (TPR) repeat protein